MAFGSIQFFHFLLLNCVIDLPFFFDFNGMKNNRDKTNNKKNIKKAKK